MKFRSKNKSDKKSKRTIIVSLAIAALMILSTVGYIIVQNASDQSSYEYNGYEFTLVNSRWVTKVNGTNVEFDFLPDELTAVNISSDAITTLKGTYMLYISFGETTDEAAYIDLARFELANDLTAQGKYVGAGVGYETGSYQLPLINCANATASIPVLYIQDSPDSFVSQDGSCIILGGSGPGLIQATDKLRYMLYGVI